MSHIFTNMSCFMPINDTYLYFLFSATNLQGKAYLPEMLKTGFDLWVGKIPWRRERLPILAWRIPWTMVHGVSKSQTGLSHFHFLLPM